MDVERYRKLREIHVEGTGVPKPVASFEEASFPGAALSPLFLELLLCRQPSLELACTATNIRPAILPKQGQLVCVS